MCSTNDLVAERALGRGGARRWGAIIALSLVVRGATPAQGAPPANSVAASRVPEPQAPAAPPSLAIRVLVWPSSARITVDGRAVQGDHVELTAGLHEVQASALGYQPLVRVIDTEELRGELRVKLVRRADNEPSK